MRRRSIVFTTIGLVLLAALYVIYWFVLVHITEQDIANWTAERRAEGYIVTIGEPVIGGFPLAVRARMAAPVVTAPGGLWRWQGPDVDLVVRPWAPYDLRFFAPGHHRLDIAGEHPHWDQVDAEGLVYGLAIDSEGLAHGASLELSGITLLDSRLGKSGIAAAKIEARLPWPPTGDPSKSALDLDVDGSGIDIPDSQTSPLGPRVDAVHLVVQVMAAPPLGVAPRRALAAWQDAGGTIELRQGELTWGPLWLSGDSTISLDQTLQPVAAGTLTVAGLTETLDAFVAAGMLEGGPAKLAQFMFGAIAKSPPGGGRPQVKLPLTIQDGSLYAGPVRLARLPPVNWNWLPD